MLLVPGYVLGGKYEVVRLAERGGMALLYEVRHLDLDLPLALKLLLATEQTDPLQTAYFQSEARALAKLRHPGVPALVDLGTLEGHPYLLMEWLDGETLGTRLKRLGKLDLQAVLPICHQIGHVLHTAHQHDIIHRDIKPGNVFLCQRVHVPEVTKVLDFGVARVPEKRGVERAPTVPGTLLGTPEYMSPEQARGDVAAISPHSDQYALGMLAYAMLRGQPAFVPRDGSPEALLHHLAAVQTEPPPPLGDHVGPAVTACILKSLSKRPEDRFGSVQAFLQALTDAQKLDAESPTRSGSTAALAPPVAPPPPFASELPAPELPAPPRAKSVTAPSVRTVALVALGFGVGSVVGFGGAFLAGRSIRSADKPAGVPALASPQPPSPPLVPLDLGVDLTPNAQAQSPPKIAATPSAPVPTAHAAPSPKPARISGPGLTPAQKQVFADAAWDSELCKPGRVLVLTPDRDWFKVPVPWPKGLLPKQIDEFLTRSKQRWLELPGEQPLPKTVRIECP